MTYKELTANLLEHQFTRVERDDRLIDVFPKETREKGVELWQKWEPDTVTLVRIRLPYQEKLLKTYQIPTKELEQLLLANQMSSLRNYTPTVEGSGRNHDIF